MRINPDRNGDPFGYCETSCRQQLRIGGDPYRVKQFIARFPWAAKNTVTVTEPEPAKKPPEPAEIPVTVTVPEPAQKKPKATFADALKSMGVGA